jgi:phosphate:Na+ symporter
MRMVRTGMTRAFGAGLRHAIGKSVANRSRAICVGIGVTTILQSSTATALMISSFSGRGLIATAPALAVMLGADIGTTMVAQLLSFDISWASPLLLAGGFILHSMAINTRPRQLGRTAIGLGIMLLALKLIVNTAEPLRDSQVLHDVISSVSDDALIAILIAALLTWLAHSSLAVVLLIMSLASTGAIPIEATFALVIGANIGGTIPPILATMAEAPEGRRVPIGNTAFKLVGALLILPFTEIIYLLITEISNDPARIVVNFHTFFNIAIACAFISFTDFTAKLTQKILPDTPETNNMVKPKHLDKNAFEVPNLALSSATLETLHIGEIVENMLRESLTILQTGNASRAKVVAEMDNNVDRLYEEVKLYVSKVMREELDEAESLRASEILTFATNLEHVGDIVENLMEMAQKKDKKRIQFSEAGLKDLTHLHEQVTGNLKLALSIFMSSDIKLARRLLAQKRKIIALERASVERHMIRLQEGRPESIETSALHMDILRDLKRIHSHVVAVVYPVLERAGELDALPKTNEFD